MCGVMERDQARADPILEGAPVGVFISERDDPSTYHNLCAGAGAPVLSPDELPWRAFGQGHYSACPIFAAALEIRETERLFAPSVPGGAAAAWGGELPITDAELELREEAVG